MKFLETLFKDRFIGPSSYEITVDLYSTSACILYISYVNASTTNSTAI